MNTGRKLMILMFEVSFSPKSRKSSNSMRGIMSVFFIFYNFVLDLIKLYMCQIWKQVRLTKLEISIRIIFRKKNCLVIWIFLQMFCVRNYHKCSHENHHNVNERSKKNFLQWKCYKRDVKNFLCWLAALSVGILLHMHDFNFLDQTWL